MESIFKPAGVPSKGLEQIFLAYDELETLGLCDGEEELTQEEAGERMGVSRGTVQRLLTSARSKVADALVNGKMIIVEPHQDP